jgi:phosphoribosylformylglycinamidine synthase
MKKKKFAVIVFPGSNCDEDCFYVIKDVLKQDVSYVWHKSASLGDVDAVILPGGFSYGDYLRTGAVARFSPVMNSVIEFAKKGKPVIGICNGFQILLESTLLPGAMLRNKTLKFICRYVNLRVEAVDTVFTNLYKKNEVIRMPIAHGEGNYYADSGTIKELNDNNQVLVRYTDPSGGISDESNPNGSLESIAGICNKKRNVFGLMPHPERSSEAELGSLDGKRMFESIIRNS